MNLILDHAPKTQRYLVGVSGGRDSVVLLHCLHELGYRRLVVCHVNHRLRGRASAADAAFVGKLAARYGYAFEVCVEDVAAKAKARKQSVETCAREVRYAFFAAMARKHRCPRVMLAHHAEDQAETVLMRVLRGTGMGGLAGMGVSALLESNGASLTLLRPLLKVRRAEIDAYIAAHKLRFREDASNADTKHTRNRVRHELLPLVSESCGRDVTPMLMRLGDIAAREHDLLAQLTDALMRDESLAQADGSLALKPALKSAHAALQHRVLHQWLSQQKVPNLDHDLIEQALRLVTERDPAKINLPGGGWLRRKAGRLWIEPKPGNG